MFHIKNDVTGYLRSEPILGTRNTRYLQNKNSRNTTGLNILKDIFFSFMMIIRTCEMNRNKKLTIAFQLLEHLPEGASSLKYIKLKNKHKCIYQPGRFKWLSVYHDVIIMVN